MPRHRARAAPRTRSGKCGDLVRETSVFRISPRRATRFLVLPNRMPAMSTPIAVVLAGAVAKGAFEAGAIRALADADVQVLRVIGASSGALNGTVLAASVARRELQDGA